MGQDANIQSKDSLARVKMCLTSESVVSLPPKGLNGVLLQAFHWYTPEDPPLWVDLAAKAEELAESGVDAMWLPPPYKGNSGTLDVGYGTYDLYDLGEFDQKGTVRTRYGTKEQLLALTQQCRDSGLQVYIDAVFNHKFGGDEVEEVMARPVDPNDRNKVIGSPRPIEAYTKFTFPGRKGKYSAMQWNREHFDAVDYDMKSDSCNQIYLLDGKQFDENVSLEKGNYDYLMGNDLDMSHSEVISDLKNWGEWIMETTGCDGFRLDAVKHITRDFFDIWVRHMSRHAKEKYNKSIFFVGEYLSTDLAALEFYSECANGRMRLFDFPLHFKFYEASCNPEFDMRTIFDDTLTAVNPILSVTFVDNHDTQPGQMFGNSFVPDNFKTIAYAIIMLRPHGYPCMFMPDYYGAEYDEGDQHYALNSHKVFLDHLLFARKNHMRGECYDYFTQPAILGWCFRGNIEDDKAMAVVVSNGEAGSERMEVCRPRAVFRELTGAHEEAITVGDDGWADFPVHGKNVAVWVQE